MGSGRTRMVAAVAVAMIAGVGVWLALDSRRPPRQTTNLTEPMASAPTLRIGVVQANLGTIEKRTQGILSHEKHLEQTRTLLAEGPVDLVIWPETAYGRALRGPLPISGRLILDDLTTPLLFGDSHEPWIHLALARLRAIEHRRFLVRATNSGVSAIVDPFSAVVIATRLLAPDRLRGTVRGLDEITPYARVGDWPGWLALVVFCFARSLTPRAYG